MAAERESNPQSDRGASVQVHVTPKGLEVQERTGEPKVVTTAADIPWWARSFMEALVARQAAEAPKAAGSAEGKSGETPKQG